MKHLPSRVMPLRVTLHSNSATSSSGSPDAVLALHTAGFACGRPILVHVCWEMIEISDPVSNWRRRGTLLTCSSTNLRRCPMLRTVTIFDNGCRLFFFCFYLSEWLVELLDDFDEKQAQYPSR